MRNAQEVIFAVMPRFYFHIYDDQGAILDTEGLNCADLDAAKQEGKASAQEMLVEEMRGGRTVDHRRIEVTAEDAVIVAVYKFRDFLH